MKKTYKDTSGTSFHGTTILISVEELINLLGEPQFQENDGNDKVNFNWDCELETGEAFTIYDWKEYRPISDFEQIEFHIGAFSKQISENAKEELLTVKN
jgi:hypothetical protein